MSILDLIMKFDLGFAHHCVNVNKLVNHINSKFRFGSGFRVMVTDMASRILSRSSRTRCLKKRGVEFLKQLHQLSTDFEHSIMFHTAIQRDF